MSVYAEFNPLISYRDNNDRMKVQLSESLGRSVTEIEFRDFVEYFNDQVIGYAENLISELANDPELWLDSGNPDGYEVVR